MSDLIKALTIFLKYGDLQYPTNCEHDVLWIAGIDPSVVSDEDKSRLIELGFYFDNDASAFYSYRYGSA